MSSLALSLEDWPAFSRWAFCRRVVRAARLEDRILASESCVSSCEIWRVEDSSWDWVAIICVLLVSVEFCITLAARRVGSAEPRDGITGLSVVICSYAVLIMRSCFNRSLGSAEGTVGAALFVEDRS